MPVLEVRNDELMDSITRQAADRGIIYAAIVALIGAVDSFTVSTTPASDPTAHTYSSYPLPVEMTATGEMGFGHSQRRDDLLSPRAMGEFIIRAADAFGLEHPHVVGPDIGTAAALFAAALHPGRLPSLVVGSGGAAIPLQLGSVLKDWVVAPDLDSFRGLDPRLIVAGALADVERYQLPDAVREDYLSSYEGDRMVESMRYVRAYPAELPVLADLLPQIQTAVQIIAGRHDAAVPPVNAEFLHDRLPYSKLDLLDAGHFTWEDAPDEYATLVTTWWDSGYATTASALAH